MQTYRRGKSSAFHGEKSWLKIGSATGWWLSCLFVCLQVSAQELPGRFGRYDIGDGLTHNSVYSILQDKAGFIWMGTESGLNRFDGVQFKHYTQDSFGTHSLSGDWILSLYEDSYGMLWIGTHSNGLNRLNPKTGKIYHIEHNPDDPLSLSHNRVWAINADKQGQLWVGTRKGLNCLNLKDYYQTGVPIFRHFIHADSDPGSLNHNEVDAIVFDKQDRLWVGTFGGGIDIYLPQSGQFRHHVNDPNRPNSLPDDMVKTMLFDQAGKLWVGTRSGLCFMDQGSFSKFEPTGSDPIGLTSSRIIALSLDLYGDIWVGTHNQGLGRIDRASQEVISFLPPGDRLKMMDNPNYVAANWIPGIFTDRTGIVWLGSGMGIYRFYNREKEFLRYKDSAEQNRIHHIRSVYADGLGTLWLGTWGNGMLKLDRTSNEITQYTHVEGDATSLSNDIVWGFAESGDMLWVTTNDGLNRLHKPSGRFTHFTSENSGLSKNTTGDLLLSSKGHLWIATWGGGVNRARPLRDGSLAITTYTSQAEEGSNLSSQLINTLIEDSSGRIWVGTSDGGLNRITPTGAAPALISHFVHDPNDVHSLSHNNVEAIYEAPDGALWVGTLSGGLNRLDPTTGQFQHFFEKDGLGSNNIKGIMGDKSGFLWLLTYNAGISRFDPTTGKARQYGVQDGLQGIEFERAYCMIPNGEMFAGGLHGLNSFFPEKIRNNTYQPEMVLTGFKKMNKPVQLDQEISSMSSFELSWQDSMVTFEFAALDYHIPEKNRYAYKLAGDWIPLEGQNFATFTSLPAGNHTLRIKGSNNDGLWDEEGLSLQIYMQPPPWKSVWAYISYVLLLIGLIWRYLRMQERKLEQERYVARQLKRANEKLKLSDRIKDQFLANTSHELRTPLNGMIGISDSMIHGATGEMTQLQKDNLLLIMGSGQRLAKLVDDILDLSKMRRDKMELHLQPVHMAQQVDVVVGLTQPLMQTKEVVIRNLIPQDLEPVDADPDRLKQVLHNLISNAVKFTEKGSVEIRAEVYADMMAVHIKDTGIGIDDLGLERIFESFEQVDGSAGREYGGTGLGLAITKSLVGLHGGEVTVSSTPGEGSTFTFTMPIAKAITGVDEAEMHHDVAAPDEETSMVLAATQAMEIAAPDIPIPETIRPGEGFNDYFKILLVDDEPVNLAVMRNMLCREEYELVFCCNGFEALDILASRSFDLILLDVMMPRMSGFEVCTQIRKQHPPEELPIVMLTAKNQIKDVVTGFDIGANDYVVKPVSQDELLVRLRTHLQLLQTSRKLHESKTRLEEYSHSLEEKVRSRTIQIRERNEELEALDDIVKTINQEVELDNLLGSLLREAHILFHNADKGLFIVNCEQEKLFRVAALDGYPREAVGSPLTWEDLARWYGVKKGDKTGGVHILNSFDGQARGALGRLFPVPACSLVMTVHVKKRVEGFLILDNFQTPDAFEQTDLNRLDRLLAHAVSAIVKARMLEEVKLKNEELMKIQKQLILQEKMAYLGNLTAGIAHEIKNPLNFVNNFAAVAVDMTKELREVLIDPTAITTEHLNSAQDILGELEQNTALIYQHGRRADRVVRSMMMHSKQGLREQQPMNLNSMLDEQYGLAYHAVYALGNSIDIQIERHYDKGLQEVVVVPHELGRALLNVFNNALYALLERKRLEGDQFQPKLIFASKDLGNTVELRIRDNGHGITKEACDKVFTPFYTTKAAGDGIGLGLSISFDIVVEGHRGRIEVDSEEGSYAEIIIILPRN